MIVDKNSSDVIKQQAIEEGRRLMPVLVEGMLLDRLPSTVEI